MNFGGKVQLVISDVPRNLHVPFISKNLDDIPTWNRKVDEYIAKIFDFFWMFLAFDGVVSLFHLDDLKVMKEVKSCLEASRLE
jgi:hypothetical protein